MLIVDFGNSLTNKIWLEVRLLDFAALSAAARDRGPDVCFSLWYFDDDGCFEIDYMSVMCVNVIPAVCVCSGEDSLRILSPLVCQRAALRRCCVCALRSVCRFREERTMFGSVESRLSSARNADFVLRRTAERHQTTSISTNGQQAAQFME